MDDNRDRLPGEPGQPRRGRPRDPAVDAAILTAAVDLLAEIGYARLTMEQVAARAGVGKASLYLRWPNKVALVAEAIQQRAAVIPALPDTGSAGYRHAGLPAGPVAWARGRGTGAGRRVRGDRQQSGAAPGLAPEHDGHAHGLSTPHCGTGHRAWRAAGRQRCGAPGRCCR